MTLRDNEVVKVSETEALRVTLCGNAETLDLHGDLRDESAAAVLTAAIEALDHITYARNKTCNVHGESSEYRDWHGGTYAKGSLGSSWCHVSLYKRERDPEADADDQDGWLDWAWASDKDASDAAKALATELSDAAEAAMSAAIEAEKSDA